jgi:hypothetical protein
MARTITTMIEGIASVGQAADSLRAVAVDQDALVGELSGQMSETLQKVEQMSDLAERLERRQHDRIAASGTARLGIGGRPAVQVRMINISSGGLRCTVPPGHRLREGDTVSVELEQRGERVAVHASVANSADGEEQEVGLQFMVSDPALGERLAAVVQGILDSASGQHPS